jgi:hypothetical protein
MCSVTAEAPSSSECRSCKNCWCHWRLGLLHGINKHVCFERKVFQRMSTRLSLADWINGISFLAVSWSFRSNAFPFVLSKPLAQLQYPPSVYVVFPQMMVVIYWDLVAVFANCLSSLITYPLIDSWLKGILYRQKFRCLNNSEYILYNSEPLFAFFYNFYIRFFSSTISISL